MDSQFLEKKENRLPLLLLWMAVVFIFAYSWVPGGLDIDSCNYAAVAKDALRAQKYLQLTDPTYGGIFYYHFPLTIWVNALLFKVLGLSSFTAKLFSMFCGVALALAVFLLGKLLKNSWAGFFAGASLLVTNHVVRLSRQCRMDIPVSLFITLAILAFILAQKYSRRYYLAFGVFSSLAILSKDIFGLAPLAIVFIYLIISLRWREFFQPLFWAGLFLAVAPVALWIWLDRNTLFHAWFHWNFLHLLESPSFHTPWYYYLRVLATKYFYLLPFIFYGGYLAWKDIRAGGRREAGLLFIWIAIFPLAFSFGRQKLVYFILPIWPAAAVLCGIALEKLFKEPVRGKAVSIITYILVAAGILIACFPLNVRSSRRFNEIVRMGPFIDAVLKQSAQHELYSYQQDIGPLLVYVPGLEAVRQIKDKTALEAFAAGRSSGPRFLFITEREFSGIGPLAKANWRVILKHKDRLLLSSPPDAPVEAVLP